MTRRGDMTFVEWLMELRRDQGFACAIDRTWNNAEAMRMVRYYRNFTEGGRSEGLAWLRGFNAGRRARRVEA